jgi:hypothetical protein
MNRVAITLVFLVGLLGFTIIVRRVLGCVRSEERVAKRPKPLFGFVSLAGIPASGITFFVVLDRGSSDWAGLGAVGVCWTALFVSFVSAMIGLLRCERPLWPAVVGAVLTSLPALAFLIGALNSIGDHFGYH